MYVALVQMDGIISLHTFNAVYFYEKVLIISLLRDHLLFHHLILLISANMKFSIEEILKKDDASKSSVYVEFSSKFL